MTESVEEFLKRGGKITVIDGPQKSTEISRKERSNFRQIERPKQDFLPDAPRRGRGRRWV